MTDEQSAIKQTGPVNEVYGDRNIRHRMIEYLGGTSAGDATAVFISRCDKQDYSDVSFCVPSEIVDFWNKRLDIGRSLWDRRSLTAHIDIEYVNLDFPAEPYLYPERSFIVQEPVCGVLTSLFGRVRPFHMVSGRGHHFVWSVDRDSSAFFRLEKLGKPINTGHEKFVPSYIPGGVQIEPEFSSAFKGLGMIIEYLGISTMERVRDTAIPVELTEIIPEPGEKGRELISLDLTEYSDPLHTRIIRMPFSVYMKPWIKTNVIDSSVKGRIPLLFAVPASPDRIGWPVPDREDTECIRSTAGSAVTRIPDCSAATERLIDSYSRSAVAQCHEYFYSQEHHEPGQWPDTYDLLCLSELPPCVRTALENPNDLLLKPTMIRLLAVVLLAMEWHPRHIAGLIRSRYERDYNWGRRWYIYNAADRADFFVRIFYDCLRTQADTLEDISCDAMRQKLPCCRPGPGCGLEQYRSIITQGALPV